MRSGVVVILHALFDLKPNVSEGDFKKVLEDFCGHLQTEGYVIGWRWMRQIVPKGPRRMSEGGRVRHPPRRQEKAGSNSVSLKLLGRSTRKRLMSFDCFIMCS
jgi:Family of unknown function (DUF6614)